MTAGPSLSLTFSIPPLQKLSKQCSLQTNKCLLVYRRYKFRNNALRYMQAITLILRLELHKLNRRIQQV